MVVVLVAVDVVAIVFVVHFIVIFAVDTSVVVGVSVIVGPKVVNNVVLKAKAQGSIIQLRLIYVIIDNRQM